MRTPKLNLLAMAVLAAAVIAAGQSVETLMNTGQELLRNGANSQAIATFRKVLARDPTHFEAQHNIAFAYLQMGRYGDAAREFKRAIQMNGKNAETWANLAFAYEAQGKSDKALEALYQSVNLDPGNVTARMNLATMYVNENKLSYAIREFKEVIKIDGTNVEAYTNLAKCLINAGKHSEAVQYLKQSISTDPGNAEAHWELGNIYFDKQKDAKKAIKEYQVAISLQSDDPRFYRSLANVHISQGEKQEAAETLRKALVYIDDALTKDRFQAEIDRLEGKTAAGTPAVGGGGPTVDMDAISEGLRDDESEKKKEERVLKTSPIDISGDFEDLEDSGDDDVLDLEKEAKKRSRK
ncbi:MAG: tetratricopeptide repeat protein [Chitinivibrionales bacterium]|nr:tetratricopeptide repeat protein [Chitinivibrionales bacterium]